MSETGERTRLLLTHAEEDDRDQTAILALVIDEHPKQLTLAELARAMAPAEGGGEVPDWLERGVGDLVGWGLLHHSGDSVRPSRAALRFQQLFN